MVVVVKTTEVRPMPVPECFTTLTVGWVHDTQFSSMKCSLIVSTPSSSRTSYIAFWSCRFPDHC